MLVLKKKIIIKIKKKIEIKIEIEITIDHRTAGITKRKQIEEKHLKFRQQLENRRAKKWKKFKERSRKEKYHGVVQEREKFQSSS